MVLEEYEELGLTNSEGKVYETLIKFGKLGAGEISRESGVSYSKIYNVLDSLISKGLVKVIPEKSKKFIPSGPEELIKLIEEKQKKLEKAKERAKELKKFYEIKEKNPVVMEIGRKGFYKIVKELKEGKEYTYSVKYASEYRPEFVRNALKCRREGIDNRSLVRYDKETEKDVKKWLKIKKDVRKIENEGVAMSVIDNEEVMIALIKSNVTLLIKDAPFAKLMKKMFEETYKNAGEIKSFLGNLKENRAEKGTAKSLLKFAGKLKHLDARKFDKIREDLNEDFNKRIETTTKYMEEARRKKKEKL